MYTWSVVIQNTGIRYTVLSSKPYFKFKWFLMLKTFTISSWSILNVPGSDRIFLPLAGRGRCSTATLLSFAAPFAPSVSYVSKHDLEKTSRTRWDGKKITKCFYLFIFSHIWFDSFLFWFFFTKVIICSCRFFQYILNAVCYSCTNPPLIES